jgi:hypothetical protein
MRGRNDVPVRTLVVPVTIPAGLLRALYDVRSGVNRLLPDWHARPQESRFEATKRCYRSLRDAYPHLASMWAVGMANEASATLRSRDRWLRRLNKADLTQWARLRTQIPLRRRLKVNLHSSLYRL